MSIENYEKETNLNDDKVSQRVDLQPVSNPVTESKQSWQNHSAAQEVAQVPTFRQWSTDFERTTVVDQFNIQRLWMNLLT